MGYLIFFGMKFVGLFWEPTFIEIFIALFGVLYALMDPFVDK
jgi:hypothetical protein